jgi:hypothetical protein
METNLVNTPLLSVGIGQKLISKEFESNRLDQRLDLIGRVIVGKSFNFKFSLVLGTKLVEELAQWLMHKAMMTTPETGMTLQQGRDQ